MSMLEGKKILIVALVLLAGMAYRDWSSRDIEHPPGVLVAELPKQTDVQGQASVTMDEYELTLAERCVAARLGLGECPVAIALVREVSEHTVRTQLRAVYASADVSDHGELSADMLKRVAFYIIPRINPDGAEFAVTTSGSIRSRICSLGGASRRARTFDSSTATWIYADRVCSRTCAPAHACTARFATVSMVGDLPSSKRRS